MLSSHVLKAWAGGRVVVACASSSAGAHGLLQTAAAPRGGGGAEGVGRPWLLSPASQPQLRAASTSKLAYPARFGVVSDAPADTKGGSGGSRFAQNSRFAERNQFAGLDGFSLQGWWERAPSATTCSVPTDTGGLLPAPPPPMFVAPLRVYGLAC